MLELVEHYDPLVKALHQYEKDKGWPPTHLDQLVPTYLAELPARTPGHVGQFSYDILFFESESMEGSSGGRIVWYEMGPSAHAHPCGWPDDE